MPAQHAEVFCGVLGKRRAVVNLRPLQRVLLSDRQARSLLLLATAVVLLSVMLEAWLALKPFVDSPVQDRRWDVDWNFFINSLGRTHEFRDTLRWWTGPWPGLAQYWRPLSAYVLWAEHLAWGPWYMLPRQIILVVLHLCFVALAGLLVFRLTGKHWLALLAVWLFGGYRPHPICDVFCQLDSVWKVLQDPKNVPEPIVGLTVIGSLLLVLRGRWVAALVIAVIGVGFKEMGLSAWPLAVMVLAWANRDRVFAPDGMRYVISSLRRNRVPIIAWSMAFVALVVIHMLAIDPSSTFGFRPATPNRFAMYFGGPIVVGWVMRDPSPGSVAMLVYAGLLLTRGRRLLLRFAAALMVLAVGIIMAAWSREVTWDVAMAGLLSWRLDFPLVLACFIWLLVIGKVPRDWRTVALGMALCLVASVPTWICKLALEHTRYIPSFFMEVAVAAALIAYTKGALAGSIKRIPVTKPGDTA